MIEVKPSLVELATKAEAAYKAKCQGLKINDKTAADSEYLRACRDVIIFIEFCEAPSSSTFMESYAGDESALSQ